MHKDKIAELEEELAHENAQVAEERRKKYRSPEQRTKDAFRQTRDLMVLNGLSFTEAAKVVGLIKGD